MLSAGPTPRIPLDRWDFTLRQGDRELARWNWEQFMALPQERVHTDIHCVTKWSKLDTEWRGVSIDSVLQATGIPAGMTHVMVHCYGGYTTNLALSDLTEGKAWVAWEFEGKPLPPEHGGPARLLVPHLYFWKSAKWVSGLEFLSGDRPGFWESAGYHMRGDPWQEQRYWGD